jgi:hypothetical protein
LTFYESLGAGTDDGDREANHMTEHAHQVFRLSAVRRPTAQNSDASTPLLAVRVSDEELVDALWRRQTQLQTRLAELANEQVPALRITAVQLEDVQPGDGVRVQLRFDLDRDETCTVSVADLSAALVIAVGELLSAELADRVAVSASPEPPDPDVAEPDAPSEGWGRLAPFLAAVGTGVGVIGFVTFVGGVIVWARVRAAGIPASPTLGIFPSQDLLVIGIETLLPMVLDALVIVVALAVFYVGLRLAVKRASPHLGERLTAHEAAVLAGETTLIAATGMFIFVLAALCAHLALFGRNDLSDKQLIAAIAVMFVAALIAAGVGSITRRFVYLATTTFVLAGLFLGTVAYWHAGNEEAIRGAAIVRDHQTAIPGIFVAEGAGRVYLAHIVLNKRDEINKSSSRLVGIAKSEVTDIAIADRANPKTALARAQHLARELCRLQIKPAKAGRQKDASCGLTSAGTR